jgi:hypothetical protein
MTLVAAYRSMGRIVTLSDTRISDKGSPRLGNRIPGRLKSIVLNRWLTVSYAGLSIQAIDAIRKLHAIRPASTESAVEYLRKSSLTLKAEVDYLVCSHEEPTQLRLIKISGAQVSEGSDLYWIGNPASASALLSMELPPAQGESGGEYWSLEERRFTRRFGAYMDLGTDAAVGGMVVHSLASPFGHCYQTHAGAYFDNVTIPDPVEPAVRQQMNGAGMDGHFKYHVISPDERGLAIVGTYFEQANVGFIHEPLISDDPEKFEARDQSDFQTMVNARAQLRIATHLG